MEKAKDSTATLCLYVKHTKKKTISAISEREKEIKRALFRVYFSQEGNKKGFPFSQNQFIFAMRLIAIGSKLFFFVLLL